MKKQFSIKWKASRQPRKQRKYLFNASLHIKKKFLSANLSKELRKKYGRRNVVLKKGDKVKIITGQFKKKEGKVTNVYLKIGKISVENIQRKKIDGSKVDIKINPSNVQIIELNIDDKSRENTIKKENNINQNKKKIEENKK